MFKRKGNKIKTIFGILILIIVIYFLSKHTHFIKKILIKSGPWAPIVALILYPLFALTPIPNDSITVIVGVTYGPLIGVIIAWIGNTIAAMFEYYLGSKFSKVIDFENERKKMPFGLGKMPVNSPLFLFVGRMIPGYGTTITSILAAAYKVPLKRYLWISALTNLLGSILVAYGGFELVKLIKFLYLRL